MNRDAPNVKSLEDMKKFIRYNDYKNDPLSSNNPGKAISSRLDLLEVFNNVIFYYRPIQELTDQLMEK